MNIEEVEKKGKPEASNKTNEVEPYENGGSLEE